MSAAAGLYLTVAILLLAPNLQWPYHDAAIFATVGEGIWRGDLPYRDLWDHKPPGIYVVSSLGWHVLWALTAVSVAATGLMLRQLGGTFAGLMCVIALAIYPAALGGGQTETFAALPAAGAVLLATRGRWMAAGALSGLALTFSFQFAPLLLAGVVLGGRVRYFSGVAAVGLAVLGVFTLLGVWREAIDALVVYSSAYLSSNGSEDVQLLWHFGVVLMPLAVGIRPRKTRLDMAMLAWLAVGFGLLLLQGRILGHYAAALVIPLAAMARWPSRPRRLVLSAAMVLAVVASVGAMRGYAQSGPATVEVGEWIRAHSSPDETILVWGVDANVYLAADRAPAGRYPYLMPLVTPGYTTAAMIDRWVATLAAAPPRIIVDAEAANPYWPAGADFLRAPPPGAAGGRNLDLLGPFRNFVLSHYAYSIEIQGRKLYALRANASAPMTNEEMH